MKKYIPVEKDSFKIVTETNLIKDEALILKNYYFKKEQYHHIEKDLLIAGSEISFDLFVQLNLSYMPLLHASEHAPKKLTPEILEYGKEGDILIKKTDMPLYREYIKSLEYQTPLFESEEKIKAILLKEKTKFVVRDVLLMPNNNKHIKESSTIIAQIADALTDNKEMIYKMISIRNHDYYTYIHSVNTAVLSIGLGIAIGMSQNKLHSLGFGALLHDIGKTSVPSEVINKPTRLSFFEFKMMQNHVMEGEKILKNQPYFPEDGLSAITQHHERINGQGYPLNLTGSHITDMGKIVGLTDCYDALTTARPYKDARSPFEALSIIVNDSEQYDSDLLRTFIKMLGGVEN